MIRSFLLGLVLTLSASCQAAPSYKYMDDRSGSVIFEEGGLCSGFNAGRGLIGLSKHCVVNPITGEGREGQQVRYQGRLMTILDIDVVGENAIIRVDGDVSPSVPYGKVPKVGDVVWIVGNPAGLPQLLRQGRVAGFDGTGMIFIDCRCTNGDSGAPVFNDKGEVVAVYFGRIEHPAVPGFNFPLAAPFGWTSEEVKALQ